MILQVLLNDEVCRILPGKSPQSFAWIKSGENPTWTDANLFFHGCRNKQNHYQQKKPIKNSRALRMKRMQNFNAPQKTQKLFEETFWVSPGDSTDESWGYPSHQGLVFQWGRVRIDSRNSRICYIIYISPFNITTQKWIVIIENATEEKVMCI